MRTEDFGKFMKYYEFFVCPTQTDVCGLLEFPDF